MNTKVAIGVGGLCVLCAAISYPIINPIVNWTSAASDTWGDNTIGKKYGKYFLSANSNRYWWNDSNRMRSNSNDKFKDLTIGYGTDPKSLNKVCESVYKLTDKSSIDESNNTDANKYYLPKIWEYCAPYIIITLDKTRESYTNQIGGDGTNKKLFVSTKDSKNDWFWRIKFEEFWASKEDRYKETATETNASENEFKKLKEDNKSLEEFKNACEKAYKKETNDNNKNKENALLFCSIKLDIGTASSG